MKMRSYLKKSTKHPHASGAGPWSVLDLCAAYQFPRGLAGGTPRVIAIIELGGGYTQSDMQTYFAGIGQEMPTIVDVSVDGTQNSPGGDADGEVALDIQVAAAAYKYITNHAATIRVYWAQDIAAGVRAATKDGCDVCSISWGADEAEWGLSAAQDMEAAAAAAQSAGMIVFAASGDNDSSDGGSSAANVDLPSSAPHVIGCGGTTKARSSETVWNDQPGNTNGDGTGGGYSTFFLMPSWQAHVAPAGAGRMVPDVAANADPDTGYQIYYGGSPQVVGGTSAVAPLYAGLFAALGSKLGSGISSKLWNAAGAACFSDVTQGDNGMFHAAIGPDPCTGLGVPIGGKLDGLFAGAPPAPPPTPPGPPNPTGPHLADAIAWAESQIPSGFMSGFTARKLIERGLVKHWPKG